MEQTSKTTSLQSWLSLLRWGRRALATAVLGVVATLPPANSYAETPKAGGTIIAIIGDDPIRLNPDITAFIPDTLIGCMVYQGLVRFAEGFKIVPGVAKSWEISPDSLTYTFHLDTIAWQDGKPLTSEDVKYTLLEVSSKFGPKFQAPGKAIDRIDTPDPQTVVIHLNKPFAPFLFSLACEQNAAIMPAHIFKGTDVLANPAMQKPIGSGGFVVNEWVHGDHITLSRNTNYWRKDLPYLDRVIVKVLPDASARLLALQSGEADFIDQYYFPLSSYAMVARDPRFQTKEVSYPSNELLVFNTRLAPIDNSLVRQALVVALDRNFIHKNVFFDTGSVGVSSIDKRLTWAYNPAIDYERMYPYDPARAKALLDQAGLKPGPDGTRFTITLTFDAGHSEYLQEAQVVQRYWQAVGVKTVLAGGDTALLTKRAFADYDFGAAFLNYTTGGDPALGVARLYVTESISPKSIYNNVSRYSNPKIDELFARGRDSANQAERAKAYFEVQEILAKDLPVFTIHQQAAIDVASVRLQDLFKAANYLWWDEVWLKP